jgi:uncharacterized protein (AIM24 family)
MKYALSGTVMQTVAIDLMPGEVVYSQTNSNILFGGKGLFLATLTGPGHATLQSMPIMNLAEEISRYLPTKRDGSTTTGAIGGAAAATAFGGILGGLFGGSNKNDA